MTLQEQSLDGAFAQEKGVPRRGQGDDGDVSQCPSDRRRPPAVAPDLTDPPDATGPQAEKRKERAKKREIVTNDTAWAR